MTFVKVCTLDDLWEGDMEVFEVDGTEILLIHAEGGEIIATQIHCPHQQVELVDGTLEGKLLTCRMHLWQFDVSTCKGVNPSHAELARYPVRIEGDDIVVDPEGDEPHYCQ